MSFSRRQLLTQSIALSASAACAQTKQPFWRVDPLAKPSSKAPGRHPVELRAKAQPDPAVEAILSRIDQGRIADRIKTLQSFETRWSLSEKADDVARWITTEFVRVGVPTQRVAFQSFSLPNGMVRRNVLCNVAPAPVGAILIGAHYDSVSESPNEHAPGADDNASGVVAMLEAATVLVEAGEFSKVICLAFCGEEQGLWGARHCSEVVAAEQWDPKLLINLDMVGYTREPDHHRIVIEYDQGNRSLSNDKPSLELARQIAQFTSEYTDLEIEHTDIWNSDYMPFEAVGVPCVGFYDRAADESFYHKSADTVSNLSVGQMVQITKALAASVILLNR